MHHDLDDLGFEGPDLLGDDHIDDHGGNQDEGKDTSENEDPAPKREHCLAASDWQMEARVARLPFLLSRKVIHWGTSLFMF
jgi:hypothetical protein